MKNILILLLCSTISLSLFSQAVFSLEEAVNYAIQHHEDTELGELNIRDAEAQLVEYKAIGLPKVNGSVNYRYNFEIPSQPTTDFITPAVIGILNENKVTTEPIPIPELQTFNIAFGQSHNFSAGVSMDALVFDGSYLVGLKAQKLFRELVSKQKDQSEYEIRAAVSKAYANVLIHKKNMDILSKNIDNLKVTREETEGIYQEGLIEKLDLERLDFSLHSLESKLQDIKKWYDISKNLLKFQMNFPLEQDIDLSDDLEYLLGTLEATEAWKVDKLLPHWRAEYRILEQNQKLNELNIRRHKKSYLPRVGLFANFARSLQDNDFVFGPNFWIPSSAIGLGIQIPIYDAKDKKAKIERAEIAVQKTNLQMEHFTRAMQLQYQNALLVYEQAQINRKNQKKYMDLAQHIFEMAQAKYREGVGSSLELAQAERDYFSAEQLYIQSLYSLLSAIIDLQIALGKI